MILCICSCSFNETYKFDNKKQEYDEGYEDIEKQIVKEYGDYVYVYMNNTSLVVALKGKYINDEELQSSLPDYQLFENIRVIVNSYIEENPDSTFSKALSISEGKIEMLVWEGHNKTIFEVSNSVVEDGNRCFKQQFVFYTKVDIFSYRQTNVDLNSYVEKMYDYIAKTGDDLKEMVIVPCEGDVEIVIQDIENKINLFPSLEIVTIYYNNTDSEEHDIVASRIIETFTDITVQFK